MADIEFAPALRLPYADPVGCLVAGAHKALLLDEGLKEDGFIPVWQVPHILDTYSRI